jgi:hypothetical protein
LISLSTHEKYSNAKSLFIHGAMFFAIIAASISIVQLPQQKSEKFSLKFQFASITSPAARVSFIGASHDSLLYHLL